MHSFPAFSVSFIHKSTTTVMLVAMVIGYLPQVNEYNLVVAIKMLST